MLNARAGDGFLAPFDFTLVIGPDPGAWRPVTPTALDPDPWVGHLRPFLMDSPDQFRSEGPSPLTSAADTAAFNEVKEIGSLTSATRTADQTTAAIFWQFTPTALWSRLFRDLSAAHGLDTVDEAGSWRWSTSPPPTAPSPAGTNKYYWSFWRPMAAIREADTDGNPDTHPDPAWRPLFDPATPTTPSLTTRRSPTTHPARAASAAPS